MRAVPLMRSIHYDDLVTFSCRIFNLNLTFLLPINAPVEKKAMAMLLKSNRCCHLLAVLLLFLLLATTIFDVAMVEGKVCKQRSKTWFGPCINSDGCNRQCQKWEHAKHGGCHFDFPGVACFCYFC
ncbi:hypothetical protein ACLOJK_032663 [Asimina triloba]